MAGAFAVHIERAVEVQNLISDIPKMKAFADAKIVHWELAKIGKPKRRKG
jgi:hypothetical protein